jgi:hypothetical protein
LTRIGQRQKQKGLGSGQKHKLGKLQNSIRVPDGLSCAVDPREKQLTDPLRSAPSPLKSASEKHTGCGIAKVVEFNVYGLAVWANEELPSLD